MARLREFNEQEVINRSIKLFSEKGFYGTSIDDLVKATKLLRGSLYKAFGSKQNLFKAALIEIQKDFKPTAANLDLLTVALKELAPYDKGIREICRQIIKSNEKEFTEKLGKNLLAKLKG